MFTSPLWKLLACLSAVSTAAAAQVDGPPQRNERELLVRGEQVDEPLLLYGTPEVSVTLMLGEPVRREGIRSRPGLDIRPHPFRDDALLITPAPALANAKAITFVVPLADGTALTFKVLLARSAGDVLVRLRRAPPLSERDFKELRAMVVHTVGAATEKVRVPCALALDARGRRITEMQFKCVLANGRAYVSTVVRCPGVAVRLVGPLEGGINLEFEHTKRTPEDGEYLTTLVLRREGTQPRGATLEFRDQEGSLCQSYVLQPW